MRSLFKHIIPLVFMALFVGCTLAKKDTGGKTQAKIQTDTTLYFKATGVEPFWGFDISEAGIVFSIVRAGIERFTFRHEEPIRAMDANVKMYRGENAKAGSQMEIVQVECINEMSGEKFPYQVRVNFKSADDKAYTTFKGCGQYVTDQRLHDIWVLEKLYGEMVKPSDFAKELPNMEINTKENTFMGYAGCNTMRGTIFFERGVLRFEKAATTLMMCQPGNKEDEFLKALSASTKYQIGNNRLVLSKPGKETLVFKKVD